MTRATRRHPRHNKHRQRDPRHQTDRAWTAEADYMFFRNFVPDCAKLATRLREQDGSTAYACQCNWISADTWAGKLPAQWFGG